MDRICAWTGGHPYLTQRVARGVARKGGRLEDVERVVREQLLAPGRGRQGSAARRRARVARRAVAAGAPRDEAAAQARRRRQGRAAGGCRGVRSGCGFRAPSASTPSGKLGVRNRIVKELVAAGWLKQKSRAPQVAGRRGRAARACRRGRLLVHAALARRRHRDADERGRGRRAPSSESYRRLRGLPGFEQRADELWLEALGRHSGAATTLAEAAAADTRLRELPGQDEAADRLLSEFWLRRARERAHAEQRDAAILARAARRGAAGGGPGRRRLPRRARRRRLLDARAVAAPRRARPSTGTWCSRERAVVSIDAQRQALRTPFGAAADGGRARRRAARAHGARALRAHARARRRRRRNGRRARAVARSCSMPRPASCS